jgi:hypothetical protein
MYKSLSSRSWAKRRNLVIIGLSKFPLFFPEAYMIMLKSPNRSQGPGHCALLSVSSVRKAIFSSVLCGP